jgi:hypothetical protein
MTKHYACRVFMAVFFVSLVSACAYEYQVQVHFDSNAVIFSATGEGGWFGPDPCADNLQVLHGSSVIWHIERRAETGSSPCENDFPIIYGKAPDGYEIVVSPQPLQAGANYQISGYGRAMFSGSFEVPLQHVRH